MSNTSSKLLKIFIETRLSISLTKRTYIPFSKSIRYRLTHFYLKIYSILPFSLFLLLSPDKSARVISFYVHVVGQHAAYPTLVSIVTYIYTRGDYSPLIFPLLVSPARRTGHCCARGHRVIRIETCIPSPSSPRKRASYPFIRDPS